MSSSNGATPTDATSGTASGPDTRSVEEIERDLERTRAQLGETVEALGAKLDVKSRTQDWAAEKKAATRRTAQQVSDEHGRELAFGIGALVAAVVVITVWRARR